MRQVGIFLALAIWIAPAPVAAQSADLDNGARQFKKCKACHDIGPDPRPRLGPHLNRVLGRRAGSVEGYVYSDAMRAAGEDGLIWYDAELHDFLRKPSAALPGTKMKFSGLRDEDDRRDLIAYLREASDNTGDTAAALQLDAAILAIVGDAEYGEYLSSECMTCHRADGANQGIPSITGWDPADFVRAMHAYKQELRPHPVMQMLASRLSDEEIAALAAYFETLQ